MSKLILKGNSVSQGVGIGGVYVCKSNDVNVNYNIIDASEVENEITNLEVSFCKTYIEIFDLFNGISEDITLEERRILDVYTSILDDVYFFEEIKDLIKNKLITADNAIEISINKYIEEIEKSQNEYVKQRISDLNDIKKRLIRNIFSETILANFDNINSNHVIVLKELNPTIAVTLGKKKVQAVIAEDGAGYLSHASIILRGSGIPTVNGVQYSKVKSYDGSLAVVDGFDGSVIFEPDDPEIEHFRELFKLELSRKLIKNSEEALDLETIDGHKVGLSVNVSNIADFKAIKERKIDGIGLVRTETLFISHKNLPSENRQTIVYSSIAKGMHGKPVNIRTIDIGGDKIPGNFVKYDDLKTQNNRGIKWSLKHSDKLIQQIRAIIRSTNSGNIKISFPMVETVDEILQVKSIIKEQGEILFNQNAGNYKHLAIGAVIETKLAIENLDEISQNVDFISIGTNDLLNQTMGINRAYSAKGIREYLNPSFLKFIEKIVTISKKNNISTSVCGEMASDPLGAIVLIGLGVDDLSVTPSAITNIKRTIRNISYEATVELINKVQKCENALDVSELLEKFLEN